MVTVTINKCFLFQGLCIEGFEYESLASMGGFIGFRYFLSYLNAEKEYGDGGGRSGR
jgi:hypothetical protein